MSAVTVTVLIGFVCCALLIRALSIVGQDSDSATERVRIFDDTPYRAMMDE
ncbi:hypothetical protein [Nocardia sp. NPDC049526]|uniref:hypothetical protein n=1 Tax=Nocardia sp. NPDC049526 TaxID=3364316 RepID=UPI003787674B